MVICAPCHKEMKVEKTGVAVHYKDGHAYMGDTFKCSCGSVIIHANNQPCRIDPDTALAAGILFQMPTVDLEAAGGRGEGS